MATLFHELVWRSNRALSLALALTIACTSGAAGQTGVLTRSYDNYRTGANTSEYRLTPQKVATLGLRKAFSIKLAGDDPRIEAQPLYMAGVAMKDGKKHDVLFLFSMGNKAYAFDVSTSEKLWETSLGAPFKPDPSDPVDIHHINRSFGILSTPVIDRDANLIYLVNWTLDDYGNRALRVYALRVSDGSIPADRPPLPISASTTNAAGQTISLDQVQKQRAALLLLPLHGQPASSPKLLYVAFTGADDPPRPPDPKVAHHGWVVAFDVTAWRQAAAWVATPSSFGGGIWQGAAGPAADDAGNVYVMTSNGGFLPFPDGHVVDFVGQTDFAESFVKLRYTQSGNTASLELADWFAPFRDSDRRFWRGNEVAPFPRGYNYQDQDLGSAGPILPPGTGLVLGAGKDGVLYVLDRNNLGKAVGDLSKLKAPPRFITYDPDEKVPSYAGAKATDNLDFKPAPGVKTHHLHGSPLYWRSDKNGPMLLVWGENSPLRAFSLSSAGTIKLLARGAELASSDLAAPTSITLGGMPGGMLTISANGGKDGIVWATAPLRGDANMSVVPGAVRAYDASDFAPGAQPTSTKRMRLLWEQKGFQYSKFCPPVVADGRLIIPTYDGQVDVYVLNTTASGPSH